MDSSTDPARAFLVEVLRTGLMLTDLLEDLLEITPPGAFPGEDTGEVLVGLLTGSIRPVVEAAGPEIVGACSALLGALGDRAMEDVIEAVNAGDHRG